MSLAEILDSIPHRPPMLLLDEIVSRETNRVVCRKTFRAEEFYFQGHYPDYPLVPGVILCEATMQAGAVLLSEVAQATNCVPVAGRLNDVKFKRMIRPGDTVEIEANLDDRVSDAYFLSGKILHEGKPACTLNFVVKLAPKQ
ncbi:3-hydroxyacyl-[acyl-carrier-protein] dehydratase FabZ [Anatilimnocola aggregata]|uniref:3-hydroxyacyl-[acyl-carrier-protein] dehydratase FabZ n=1 Tax=Anatilimnocola aggregata TaxID=2528021 RepID=A0A517YAX5_9BACT|nr:3-hydroxyacyl-ACP dehydratase FabZ family protein [Anatilimnocola aggregata]QDU27388.1 3-hydroxyacyl-[acyl-carrier-protein] dehydratase FabZ [Anatilimnocola aggregata]